MATSWRFGLLASLLCPRAHAQVYEFKDKKVPLDLPRSLEVLYTFYIYAVDDEPLHVDGQVPSVTIRDLRAVATVDDTSHLHYQGIQVSLLPQRDFWKLINPQDFCNAETHLVLEKTAGVPWAGLTQSVPVVKPGSNSEGASDVFTVPATGAYYLVLSNCGTLVNFDIFGIIEVRNSHGFLPASDYFKVWFHAGLCVLYLIAGLAWLVALCQYRQQVSQVHYFLTFIYFTGLLECGSWLGVHVRLNKVGLYSNWLVCTALLSSVLKSGLFYVLSIYLSLGWSIIHPTLEFWARTKVELFTCFYFPLQYLLEGQQVFRFSHPMNFKFTLACWVPQLLLCLGMVIYTFVGLMDMAATLEVGRQEFMLTLTRRLTKTTALMALGLSVTMLFTILDISGKKPPASWHYQWMLSEGVSDTMLFILICVMMYLLAPAWDLQQYMYTVQPQEDKGGIGEVIGAPVWADEGASDGELEDESGFWTMTHSKSGHPMDEAAIRGGTVE